MEIHQMMSQAQTEIPGQVLRQQPVYLEDARGVLAPFHLEFVTSAQILIHALKERYSEDGARKVDQGKFAITDAKTSRDIDLRREWKLCFRPGQRVNMSLFFEGIFGKTTTCPSCHAECAGDQDREIECGNCAMIFRRIEIIQPQNDSPSNRDDQTRNGSSNISERSEDTRHDPAQVSHVTDSPSEDEEPLDGAISEYKRVRLLDYGRVRWDPSTCAQELRISKTGLGVTFPGPRTSADHTTLAFVKTTPWPEENRVYSPRHFNLNGEQFFEFEISQNHPSSLFPMVGLRDGAGVVASFGARPFSMITEVKLWVCCNCKWTSSWRSTNICINCHHGFGHGHCTIEKHGVPAYR
ncbi:hypothetical protein F5144DRAFT_207203 [Chaetomium tenue]|uniref:Uncharacterized protein n=1 Tax=Chaetomium tenue TaxID=1854479 RepID=A0ACB7PEB7_9PEZI|nr:hypothetical protein F5144DRAFT_207203 [Chaetomium globosum]